MVLFCVSNAQGIRPMAGVQESRGVSDGLVVSFLCRRNGIGLPYHGLGICWDNTLAKVYSRFD